MPHIGPDINVAAIAEDCRDAIRDADHGSLIRAFAHTYHAMNLFDMVEELIAPLMRWVGDEWARGTLDVAREHLATATLRAFLDSIKAAEAKDRAPLIVVTTPADEHHELGAMIAAITASAHGWREQYFGPNLPATEIVCAVERSGASAVGISVLRPDLEQAFLGEAKKLTEILPGSTHIIAGGPVVQKNRLALEAMGIHCPITLAAYCDVLSFIESSSHQS